MRDHGRSRLRWTRLAPRLVQRIGRHGFQLRASFHCGSIQRRERLRAVQTCVIADDRTRRCGLQPGRDAIVLQRPDLELPCIHLGPDLNGVTTIGEDSRPVC